MTSDRDIAISEIDAAKEPEKLVGIVNEWYTRDIQNKIIRAATWSQSLHFLSGDQWIRYNDIDRKWQSIPVTRTNRNIDRPVANYILVYVTTNAAMFTGRPTISINPNTDDPRDKTASEVCEVIKEYLWEENDKDDQYYEAALWGISLGITFRKSSKLPSGRVAVIPTGEVNAETGQSIDRPITLRNVKPEIISPYNMTFDGLAKRFQDVGVVMESSIRRLEWIKDNYDQEGPGYTGHAKDLTEALNLSNILSMGEAIKDIVEGNSQTGYGYKAHEIANSNIVHEIYVRPTRKHQQGLMIVTSGDKLLYYNDSPYYYLDGKVWHPYTSWNYLKMPGNMWGLSLIQQLIPKQRSINSIDALIAYNRKTMAVGTWLIPTSSGIPDESLVGVPGQNISYHPGERGERPMKESGVPLPGQVLEERNNHLADMDRISNSADVRGGRNPSGVKTLGQLQILSENAERSMSKSVSSWEKFLEQSEQLDLLNFQSAYIVPDPRITRKLKMLSKDLSSFDWDSFRGDALNDNVSVRIEPGSTLNRSNLVQRDIILQLAKLGLLPDIASDPFQHKLFLEKFGVSDLFNESDMDIKKAEKTIEMMMNGIYPPVEEQDSADKQLLVLARYMKNPKFMDYEPSIKILFKKRWRELLDKLAQSIPPPVEPMGPGAPGVQGGGKQNGSRPPQKMMPAGALA